MPQRVRYWMVFYTRRIPMVMQQVNTVIWLDYLFHINLYRLTSPKQIKAFLKQIKAVEREVLEEIHQRIIRPKLFGVVENLFSFDGQQGHEIVFVYGAEFIDSKPYQHMEMQGYETDGCTYIARLLNRE